MARSGMSQRRAARLVGCDPKTLRRGPDRRDDHIRERLRSLEEENRKLKKLLAESMLDQAALKELLTKNGRARRQARGCRSFA